MAESHPWRDAGGGGGIELPPRGPGYEPVPTEDREPINRLPRAQLEPPRYVARQAYETAYKTVLANLGDRPTPDLLRGVTGMFERLGNVEPGTESLDFDTAEVDAWNEVVRPFVRETLNLEAFKDAPTWNMASLPARLEKIDNLLLSITVSPPNEVFKEEAALPEDAFYARIKIRGSSRGVKRWFTDAIMARRVQWLRAAEDAAFDPGRDRRMDLLRKGLIGVGLALELWAFSALWIDYASFPDRVSYCDSMDTFCRATRPIRPSAFWSCLPWKRIAEPTCFLQYGDGDNPIVPIDMSRQDRVDFVNRVRSFKNPVYAYLHMARGDDEYLQPDRSQKILLSELATRESYAAAAGAGASGGDLMAQTMREVLDRAYDVLPAESKRGPPLATDPAHHKLEAIMRTFFAFVSGDILMDMLSDIHLLNMMATGRNDTSFAQAREIMILVNGLMAEQRAARRRALAAFLVGVAAAVVMAAYVLVILWG